MMAEHFAQAIETAGLIVPDNIYADGLLHRFSATGGKADKSGWYVLHADSIPAGVFGCWRTGLTQTWCSRAESTLTPSERDTMRQRVKDAKAQRDATTKQHQQFARKTAYNRWNAAKPTHHHPYTQSKGITATGLRVEADGTLLAPMRDVFRVLHSLQTIAPDGSKRFLTGGRVRGCYHCKGVPAMALVVCEGVATGHSIHEATGLPIAAAFSASNLEPVARALHQQHPRLQLLIAADDDHTTEGNPGVTAARAAALAVGGLLVTPQFPAGRPRKATDFNDLFSLAGASAVRACFAEVWEGMNYGL